MLFSRKEIILRSLKTSYLASPLQFPDKPVLVFIHGFPDNAHAWQYQWESLGQEFDWLAPFLPGTCDDQEFTSKRYRLESLVFDYLQILNTADYAHRSFVLIGHDLGGPIVDTLNDNLAQRCQGVIYINTFSLAHFKQRILDPKQIRKSYYIALFQVPKVPKFLMDKLTRKTLALIYNKGGVSKEDELRSNTAHVFKAIKLYKKYFQQLLKERSIISTNKNKKLLILGTKDPFITIPSLDEVDKFYKNSELRVLPENHWLHRTRPERVNTMIKNFINTCDGGRPA